MFLRLCPKTILRHPQTNKSLTFQTPEPVTGINNRVKMHIQKFVISEKVIQSIQMPINSQILSLQIEDGFPCIYALVEETDLYVNMVIEMFEAGYHIDGYPGKYIGIFQRDLHTYHVFIK